MNLLTRQQWVVAILVFVAGVLSGDDQPVTPAPTGSALVVQQALATVPSMLATASDAARNRLVFGIAHIFASQDKEHQRLVAYQPGLAAFTATRPAGSTFGLTWWALVGFLPGARQWNPQVVPGTIVDPLAPGSTTSSQGLGYYIRSVMLNESEVTGISPGASNAYLQSLIGVVDNRYQQLEASFIQSMTTQVPGATLADALGIISAPDITKKAANAAQIMDVLQAHDLVLAQLSVPPSSSFDTVYHHALMRLQIGGIPQEFLYNGPTNSMQSNSTAIAVYAQTVYADSGAIGQDTIDASSLQSWVNTVYFGRYQLTLASVPPVPAPATYTGGELAMIGTPATYDDLETQVIGAVATYGQILSNALAPLGDQIDSDADAELASINSFDNYMENVWAIQQSESGDGIDYAKLAALRAIIAPGMAQARIRAATFFSQRALAAYNAASALSIHANAELSAVVAAQQTALISANSLYSANVDSILNSKLGSTALQSGPLFISQALTDLHNDLVLFLSAIQGQTIGIASTPPPVSADKITANVDNWFFSTSASQRQALVATYASFPYPTAPGAMTLQDYLTCLWIDELGVVQALGANGGNAVPPKELTQAYQDIQQSPALMQRALVVASGFTFATGTTGSNVASDYTQNGMVYTWLSGFDVEVQKMLAYEGNQNQAGSLILIVPSRDYGNAVQMRTFVPPPSQQPGEPVSAPLLNGVEGFLPLQANLSGYALALDGIARYIANAANATGTYVSVAQRKMLLLSGICSVTSPVTAQMSPSTIYIESMRRSLAIDMGRTLAAVSNFSTLVVGLVPPTIPPGNLPLQSGRPSAAYEWYLLGDAASVGEAEAIANLAKSTMDQTLALQWSMYRLASDRVAMVSLNALEASAYAATQTEPRRSQAVGSGPFRK